MANKAAQATSFSLMLVRYYKITVLMTLSVRSIPPPPCHQSSSVRQPPSPLDDDVICGCPLRQLKPSFIRVAVGREWWAARDSWCERNCDDTTSVGWSHHDHCCRRVATTDRQHELAGALLTTSQTHTTQSLYTVSQKNWTLFIWV